MFDDIKASTRRLLTASEDVLAEESSVLKRMIQSYSHKIAGSILDACDAFDRNRDESVLLSTLETILSNNWDLVKGTALSYTSLPKDPSTQLLCDVATFVAQKKATPSPAILLLMPGISVDSLTDDLDSDSHRLYPDFDSTSDLARVLSTHIMDRTNKGLIPVRLLTGIETSEHSQALINPYYNYQIEEMSDKLNAEELERLSEHSTLTQEVIAAKKNYELLLNDRSNFLGHINELCRYLLLNNAYAGIGQHESAGSGAYPAIFAFSTYYQALGDDEKLKIPHGLRLEIDKLLALSSDPSKNINATENLETCIANRRIELLRQMNGHEERLSQIGVIDGEVKAGLLAKAKADFITAKDELKRALDAPNDAAYTYSEGYDPQGLTKELLRTLAFKLSFESLKDFDVFKTLRASEIDSIMSDEELKEQFIDQLDGIDNLVIICQDLSAQKISSLFKCLDRELMSRLIRGPRELAALLISLDTERVQAICSALKDHLCDTYPPYDLLVTLALHLTADQFNAIALTDFIHTPNDLAEFFDHCIKIESRDLLEKIGEIRIRNCMDSLIHTPEDLEKLLQHHSFRTRTSRLQDIVSIMGEDRFLLLMETKKGLNVALKYGPPEIAQVLREKIRASINTIQDLQEIYDGVNSDGCGQLSDLIEPARIDDMIKTKDDLITVFKYYPMNVSHNHVKKIGELIKTIQDYEEVCAHIYFHSKQGAILRALGPDRTAEMIQTSKDLELFSKYFAVPPYGDSLEGPPISINLEKKVIETVDTIENLQLVLPHFKEEARQRVFSALKSKIPTMINNLDDLAAACNCLNMEEKSDIFHQMVEPLTSLLRYTNHVSHPRWDIWNAVLSSLTEQQVYSLLIGMKDQIGSMIKSESDLLSSISNLSENNVGIVIDALKQKTTGIFDQKPQQISLTALGQLSKKLSVDHFQAFLKIIETQDIIIKFDNSSRHHRHQVIDLLSMSLNQLDRSKWLVFLSEWPALGKERYNFYANESLPVILDNAFPRRELHEKDIVKFLKLDLSPQESAVLFRENTLRKEDVFWYYIGCIPLGKRADTLIANAGGFVFTMEKLFNHIDALAHDDLAKTLRAMSDKMARELHGDIDALTNFIHKLSQPQRSIFLSHMIENMLPLIKTKADLNRVSAYFTPEERATNRYLQLLSTTFSIAEHPAVPNDMLLKAYVADALARINAFDDRSDIDGLQLALSSTLDSLRSTEVLAVNQYIYELMQKSSQCGFLVSGYSRKAASIREALSKIPPESRGTVLTGEVNPVQRAITKGSFTGQEKGALLDKVKGMKERLRAGRDAPDAESSFNTP